MNEETTPSPVPETGKPEGEALAYRYSAEPLIWSEKMLAALERRDEGSKWFSLIDKVYRVRTLEIAWGKVSDNAGACGVDGITIARFGKDSQKRLLAVSEQLRNRSYQPQAVKRAWIPKAGSKTQKRPLGIPTVRDRVVQSAVKLVVEPIFEREFAEHSYGFRPGRSCKDALRRVTSLLKEDQCYVVDADIKSFFERINHERLMDKLREHIADGRILELIEQMLKNGIMENLKYWEAEEGTPQGGVISPLLANIYLNELDQKLAQAGFELTRYADDFVVMCKTAKEAQAALSRVREWMAASHLELNEEKTRTVNMTEPGNHFEFLGYRLIRSRKTGRIAKVPRPKSVRSLRARLKPMTKRNNGNSMETITERLNPILRGWYEYFKHCSETSHKEVDRWVRGRLRGILRKRRKRKGRGRGSDHQRWPNAYFEQLGLFNLEKAQGCEIAGLQHGAKH